MLSLSDTTASAADNPTTSPVWLVQIEFSGLTLYLCSSVFGEPGSRCILDSQVYEPMISRISAIQPGQLDPVSWRAPVGRVTFDVDNTVPVGGSDRFTDLFDTYNPHYADVTVSLIFDGAIASADKVDRFKGQIDDLPGMTATLATVTCTSMDDALKNKLTHTIVTTDDYADADPDDVGHMLPIVYGQCRRVPFRALDAGAVSPLAYYINSTATSLYLTDTTGFPTSGTVTIQIGTEQMTFSSGNLNTTTGEVTSITRGANTTTAAEHSAGDGVGVVQTEYVYAIGHSVNAINRVYIADVMVSSSDYTAYTGQTGDQLTGYGSLACIKFTALAWIEKQFNISVSDDLDVTDDKVLTVPGTTCIRRPSGGQANCRDGSAGTYYTVTNGTWQSIATFPTDDYGDISRAFVHMIAEFNGATGEMDIQVDASTIGSISATYAGVKDEFHFEWTGVDTDDWGVEIKAQCDTASETGKIYEIWWEYEYTADTNTASGSVELTGGVTGGNSVADTVVGGTVSADVDGFQDDGSGTYTGSASSLIERPDHILKHMLIELCGLTSSEIDSTTYTAAGTFFNTESYTLAVAMLDKPNVRQLLADIAHQSAAFEFWEAGTHYLIARQPGVDTSDKTLSHDDRHFIEGRTSIKYTARVDIQNKFTGRYDRHWSGHNDDVTADRYIVTADDSTSDTEYGTLEGQQRDYPYIITSAQALHVLELEMYDLRWPRRVLFMPARSSALELQRGDMIALDFTEGDYLDQALVGKVATTDLWQVTDTAMEPDGTILLRMVETPAPLVWSENNQTTYTPPASDSDSYTITFYGGVGPYTWAIDTTNSTGITIENEGGGETTSTPINTLYISSAAEGSAIITITDAEGNEKSQHVMSTAGDWVQQSERDGECVINGITGATLTSGSLAVGSFWAIYEFVIGYQKQEGYIWRDWTSVSGSCSAPVAGHDCAVTCETCSGATADDPCYDCMGENVVTCENLPNGLQYSCWCTKWLKYYEWGTT